jgi:hypothetical protein
MSRARVHCFSVSLDGRGAGAHQLRAVNRCGAGLAALPRFTQRR